MTLPWLVGSEYRVRQPRSEGTLVVLTDWVIRYKANRLQRPPACSRRALEAGDNLWPRHKATLSIVRLPALAYEYS